MTTNAVPFAVTTVMHVLGEGLSAAGGPIGSGHDAIIHEGFVCGLPETTRAIVGGTGRSTGVQGDVIQMARGENDTVIQVTREIAVPAPNCRFTFRFKR